MLKKIFFAAVIIGAAVLVYTENTGKTHLAKQVYSLVLHEDMDEGTDGEANEEDVKYKLKEDNSAPQLSPGQQAIKDAGEYHSEAKKFARDTSNAVNSFNESVK